MTEEICECGHEGKQHMILTRFNPNYERCCANLCKCKKFKPKKEKN